MSETLSNNSDKRIEFRVSSEDKELFEYAKFLSGFTSFSEFARFVLARESKKIVEEKHRTLASERDKEIFFNALMGNEDAPNTALLDAIKFHEELIKQ